MFEAVFRVLVVKFVFFARICKHYLRELLNASCFSPDTH